MTSGSNKFALVVGCNYATTDYPLESCIPDALSVASFLDAKGYSVSTLTDDQRGEASAKAVYRRLSQLLRNMRKGTTLVVYFSGHGTQVSAKRPEVEKFDQVLVFGDGTAMMDDDLKALLKTTPSECKIVVLIDMCNSGTMCDLPFEYDKRVNNQRVADWKFGSRAMPSILSIAACGDHQTAKEVFIDGQYRSVFTMALLELFKKTDSPTPVQIARVVDEALESLGMTQRVTLTSTITSNFTSPLRL